MSSAAAEIVKPERFTAISGVGMIVCSLLTPAIAYCGAETNVGWIESWMGGAFLCAVIMIVATILKAGRAPDIRRPSRVQRALRGFGPVALAGVYLTWRMYPEEEVYLPAVWLGCYGLALITGGALSAPAISVLGVCLIGLLYPFFSSVVGFGLTPLPNMGSVTGGDAIMVIGFGAIQLIFGIYIAIRYKG